MNYRRPRSHVGSRSHALVLPDLSSPRATMGAGASSMKDELSKASDAELAECVNQLAPEDLKASMENGKEAAPAENGKEAAPAEKKEAAKAADIYAGPVDVSSLTRKAKDDLGMMEQPKEPKFKLAMLEVYVRDKPFGGADKSSNGHRYDTVPFVNGMIMAGMSCQPIHYLHEEHDKFFEVCAKFDALIIRCNPGQINDDGGDRKKFDDSVRELQKKGIQAWLSPDVMEFMGAKDALTKIAKLNIGLEDT